jgi:hypothetical protein
METRGPYIIIGTVLLAFLLIILNILVEKRNANQQDKWRSANCVESYTFEPIKITYKNSILKEPIKGDLGGFFILGIGGIDGSISGGEEKEILRYRMFLKDEYGSITPYDIPSEKIIFRTGGPSVSIKGIRDNKYYGLGDSGPTKGCIFLKRNIGTVNFVELVTVIDKAIITIPENSIKITVETEIGNYIPDLSKQEIISEKENETNTNMETLHE